MDNMPIVRPSVCRMCQAKESRIAALSAENARLREALEQVEWSGFVLDDEGCVISYLCPLCDQVKEKGHSPYCLVGIALDAARGRQG